MSTVKFSSDSFIAKDKRPWDRGRLARLTIVGHTAPTSARIWVRTDEAGDFTILVYRWNGDEDDWSGDTLFQRFNSVPFDITDLPAHVVTLDLTVGWETDTTGIVEITGLEADATYRYAVYRSDASEPRITIGRDRPQQFRTFPSGAAPIGFAFFSCHRPFEEKASEGGSKVLVEAGSARMWDHFLTTLRRQRAEDLRFVIGGGDQVYVDTLEPCDIWRFLDARMRREGGRLLPDLDDMVTWYRDVYRGYWNFNALKGVFSDFPTYMIWDDHEILDGWGSHYHRKKKGLEQFLPSLAQRGLDHADGLELMQRMFAAATRAYREYQHSHNPQVGHEGFDYDFTAGACAFYVLDTRGCRDLYRRGFRILGREQFERFRAWLAGPDVANAAFVFVVSAVPMVHMRPFLGSEQVQKIIGLFGGEVLDDLRDSWEDDRHEDERKTVLAELFGVAAQGKVVAVLSGDVHVATAFRLTNGGGASVWQLTSSAITYTQPKILGWLLSRGVPRMGSIDGWAYERVGGVYAGSNFAIVSTDPVTRTARFELYGLQEVHLPDEVSSHLADFREVGVCDTEVVAQPVSQVLLHT